MELTESWATFLTVEKSIELHPLEKNAPRPNLEFVVVYYCALRQKLKKTEIWELKETCMMDNLENGRESIRLKSTPFQFDLMHVKHLTLIGSLRLCGDTCRSGNLKNWQLVD